MGTSKSNRKRRKMTGSKSSGFEEVRVDNKRNLESMRAQKMDNDSGSTVSGQPSNERKSQRGLVGQLKSQEI